MSLLPLLLAAVLLLTALRPAPARADAPTTTSSILVPTIDAERAANGLGPLAVDPRLEQVAMDRLHYLYARSTPAYTAISHCVDVRDDEQCHTSGYAAAALLPGIWWGENLASIDGGPGGAVVNNDADRAWSLRLWWASPPHRANTLGMHFRRVGTAELTMPGGAVEYVEVFSQ